jgi:hypothetical protein
MTRTHALLTVAAACHLALVVCGAAHQRLVDEPHPVGRALRWYGGLSGSDSGYGFFAPGVAGERRLVCTLTDAAGHSWAEPLEMRGQGREVDLRVLPLLLMFSEPDLGDAMAASVAAKMFGRFPAATRVTVRVDVCVVPTMEEYRAGDRPTWAVGYEATFSREDDDCPEDRS